jgi:2-C-methyl-D-erythritol 4-phosphate cytidylyltransferase
MIHYGASPFTSPEIVSDAIRVCKEHGRLVSCTPCYQLSGTNDRSLNWVNRDKYTQIACSQCFRYEYLLNIYKRAEEKGLLNIVEPHTTSLMYALGDTISQSSGNQTNVKITTKEDLELFEGYVMVKLSRML